MRALGEQLGTAARWNTRNPRIHAGVVPGPWKHLVFGHPVRLDGTVDRGAYIFAVLTEFCRYLKNREIYAEGSTRYRNPQALHVPKTSSARVARSYLVSADAA